MKDREEGKDRRREGQKKKGQTGKSKFNIFKFALIILARYFLYGLIV
jgi:hypothetical protein